MIQRYLKGHSQVSTFKSTVEYIIFSCLEFCLLGWRFEINILESSEVGFWASGGKTTINHIASKTVIILFSHDRDSLIPVLVFYRFFGTLNVEIVFIFVLLVFGGDFGWLGFYFELHFFIWRSFWFLWFIIFVRLFFFVWLGSHDPLRILLLVRDVFTLLQRWMGITKLLEALPLLLGTLHEE